jgi:hypothetical protein
VVFGASLTLISTSLADFYGATNVLGGCAIMEIALGVSATFYMLYCYKRKTMNEVV